MLLVGHEVILYTYSQLHNVPEGVKVLDANSILDKSKIFKYNNKFKTYSGFANWFRFKRLFEYGGTWLDLDILLIKNINEVVNDEIAICSEPSQNNYILPNNAFMRFPQNNELIKHMLEYAEKVGSDAKHAETGPTLVNKLISTEFYEYTSFLKNFNVNNLLGWYEIDKYKEKTEQLLLDTNIDEIFGFHFINTHFSRLNLENYPLGLYNDLKTAIIVSNNKNEYIEKLKELNILKMDDKLILKNRDLQYAKITTEKKVKYTFLIDMTQLKKVELYTFLTSVEKKFKKPFEFLIFGKNNISMDSIKFKENLKIFNSKFEDINFDIINYINGEYIIPIKEPVFFQKKVLKDYSNIDIQIINFKGHERNSKIYILRKNTFIYFNKFTNIFKLNNIDFNTLNFRFITLFSDDIISFGNHFNKNELRLMEIIDNINDNEIIDFEQLKKNVSNFFNYNLVDRISFFYYSKCKNIVESETYEEYKLKEENDYLKQISNCYLDELRYIKNKDMFKKV